MTLTKILVGLIVAAFLIVSIPVGKKVVDSIKFGGMTQELENKTITPVNIPTTKDLLTENPPKELPIPKTLILESKNTFVFRGPVTGESVGKAIKKLSKMSRELSKSDIIYLVLDTPGGSVFDGAEFIDFLEGIPQEVRTVTIFAASMGFQIVENNPGKRLITRSGTLMSHRAALDGLGGQLDGELETRYRMIKRKVDYLEVVASSRVGMTLEQYRVKIKDEWWIHGFDSVNDKVADEMVLIQCGTTMDGENVLKVQTFFGIVRVVFDACPLVREPISIEFNGISQDAQGYVKSVIRDLFYDKTKFVKDVILTNKFYKIFP